MRNRLPFAMLEEAAGVALRWQGDHLLSQTQVSMTNSRIGWAQRLDLGHQTLQREHLQQNPKCAGQSCGNCYPGNYHVHLDVNCFGIPAVNMADFGNSQGTDFDDTEIGLGYSHAEEICLS